MFGTHRATLVIPALNEEEGVVATIERAPAGIDEIIVIDGGSADSTRINAERAGAAVIVQLVRGYGLAYKTGFIAATGDIIITGDADGTYPVELAPQIAEEMDRRGLDFVSCSRFPLADRQSMESLNQFGNRSLSLLGSVVSLKYFRDLLSGMWIFRKSALTELRLATNGWNFSAEIKLEAAYKLGRRFAEVHIPYRERVGMTHNVRPFRIGGENALFIIYKRMLSALSRLCHAEQRGSDPRQARGQPPVSDAAENEELGANSRSQTSSARRNGIAGG